MKLLEIFITAVATFLLSAYARRMLWVLVFAAVLQYNKQIEPKE